MLLWEERQLCSLFDAVQRGDQRERERERGREGEREREITALPASPNLGHRASGANMPGSFSL